MLPVRLASIVLVSLIVTSAFGDITRPGFNGDDTEPAPRAIAARSGELLQLAAEHRELFKEQCGITNNPAECGDFYECDAQDWHIMVVLYENRIETVEGIRFDIGAGRGLYQMKYVDGGRDGYYEFVAYKEIFERRLSIPEAAQRKELADAGIRTREVQTLIQWRYATTTANLINCITSRIAHVD